MQISLRHELSLCGSCRLQIVFSDFVDQNHSRNVVVFMYASSSTTKI